MRVSGVLATAAGLAILAHAAPSVTALSPVRRTLAPRLAGIGDRGSIALTFDDGPDPRSTPAFLGVLAAHRVRATFFLLGEMVDRAPALAAELVAAGHEIAVHGHQHRPLLLRSPSSTVDDMARAYETIAAATGTLPRFYRPPYGVLSTSALAGARRLGLTPVLWTAWGRDWTEHATSDSVVRTVHKGLRSGGTILLHDSDCASAPGAWRSTLAALPSLLDACAHRDLKIGPLCAHWSATPVT